jgi:outer membrane protein OmpA-like peptidoglycan-associated protein
MNRHNSMIFLSTALVLAAPLGCKNPQRDEPAEAPETEHDSHMDVQPEPPAATAPPVTPPATAAPAPSPTAEPAPAPTAAPTPTDPDLLVVTITGVDIDTRLAEICALPGSSVFFKYDSARLSPEAKERLQAIATCVLKGAAKGRDLVVVGRTDPVGPDDYNKQLGMSRAENVVKYLRDLGVKKSRVETLSAGESGAIKDPYGWPISRRVTIRILP